MNIRYYMDPDTGLPHIYNHNVDESEVEDVLLSPGEDWRGRRGARIAIGRTQAGRYLQVIYTPDPDPSRTQDDSVFVITAYDLRGKPLAAYKRRQRRRGRR